MFTQIAIHWPKGKVDGFPKKCYNNSDVAITQTHSQMTTVPSPSTV